ncbi:MAG: hemolysin III family protein [Lachnospiraceae bacterium]|nr:hemolysin III family protein [Lachnospiraceae bacterium]
MKKIVQYQILHPKDPGSAYTHFIGMLLIALAMIPLLIQTFHHSSHVGISMFSMFVFCSSMFLLYTASTTYHTFSLTKAINRRLKKCDHMMIFIMIAGSYTPVCLLVLGNPTGYIMCGVVWGMAILGMILKACWVTCPKWFSSIIYIAMGWTCIFSMAQIIARLPHAAFILLFLGGVCYTIGGVIYALKLPLFNARHKYFGTHEIFHVFVLFGSLFHYAMMYTYVSHF